MNEEEFLASTGQPEEVEEAVENEVAEELPEVETEAEVDTTEAAPKLNETQQKAYDQGWRPKEDFKGDPDNWTSAGAFIRFKEMNSHISDLKNEKSKQNDLHKFQIDRLKKELEKKVSDSVEEGDLEAFRAHQNELDEINRQRAQFDTTPSVAPEISAWNARNANIVNDPARTGVAQSLFADIENKNPYASVNEQLQILDSKLAALYNEAPAQNPRRVAPSTHESRGKAAGTAKKRELTMSDLTRDEEDSYRAFGKTLYNSEKEFLKAVQKTRNGEK